MQLKDIIRAKREQEGLSIEDLSKITSIPKHTIERLENDPQYFNTPHGRLHAKALIKFLNIDYTLDERVNGHPITDVKIDQNKFLSIKGFKYIPHIVGILTFIVFLYANAINNKETKVDITNYPQNISSPKEASYSPEKDTRKEITLISNGDVWITVDIDGEKQIFNIKDGETKTITFDTKLAFETIGNVNKLTMLFKNQQVSIKDKEIIHNMFVDEEGIFYNGYNILRGKPKI